MHTSRSSRPLRTLGLLATTGAVVASLLAPPAQADPVYIPPVRSIGPLLAGGAGALANNGTLYVSDYSTIQVWGPGSQGSAPDLVKSFTGVNVDGQISLLAGQGLAYIENSTGSVNVIDPAQADGPAVPVRSISGPATTIDDPLGVAWTADGSLWVLDGPGVPPAPPIFDLLRFAPGADGDAAPVQQISGTKTGLSPNVGIGTLPALAGLPGNGVAVGVNGLAPGAAVFTGAQSGNVKPARVIKMRRDRPNWLTQGLAADAKGRIYLGAGPIENEYGRLDVFAPNANGWAKPLISLGGMESNIQIAAQPTVAPNGDLALIDIHVIALGASPISFGEYHVYKSLFLKPGKVKALKAKAKGKNATITWKAGANPSKTAVGYQVVIKKGKKTVASKKTTALKLTLKRKSLPKGKLKVSVVASNIGGKSAAAKKNLKN